MIRPPREQLPSSPTGQSLIEILVGVAVTGIVILAAANLLHVVSVGGFANRDSQSAIFLAGELMENTSAYAHNVWYCVPVSGSDPTCQSDGARRGLYNLTKGPAERYHLTGGSPFFWEGGAETIGKYSRFFYVENICRNDGDGAIVGVEPAGGCAVGSPEDPSTQKVTGAVTWNRSGNAARVQLERYLTRSRNAAIGQTNWIGGGGQTIFDDPAQYDAAVNIDIGKRGSITINGY